jgi:hypothetical protein
MATTEGSMKALKIVGMVVFGLLFVAFFGGAIFSELIGAYWPELGKQIAELIGGRR